MNRRDFLKRTLSVAVVATVPIGIASNTASAKLRDDRTIGDISETKAVGRFDYYAEYGQSTNLPPRPTDAEIRAAINDLIQSANECLPVGVRYEIRASHDWRRTAWYSQPAGMEKDVSWRSFIEVDLEKCRYEHDEGCFVIARLIT